MLVDFWVDDPVAEDFELLLALFKSLTPVTITVIVVFGGYLEEKNDCARG